ncbi:MFS transporter [Bacillus manliponensis]|uniref:MFS transporter n=1 Tax=Bacillus manliponensis TaxID=574376 RepID=A0A073KEI6_9BACI|nr:MFS transporter [Bacillus manliponensis]KEK20743.1 MFS transporter [Bacillus manliponensis]
MGSKYRYYVFGMMMFITIINYIDRGAIAYAQAFIIAEYGFDPKEWGAILGYFGYGYMIGSLLGGIFSDKKGPKFVWIIAAISWSIFEIATAFAGEIGMAIFGGSALAGFALFRVLFGLTEGPSFAVSNKTAANWAAPKERAFLTSVGFVGVPIGALLTAPVAVMLLSITSWKMMFFILGAIGIVWAIIWYFTFTSMPEDHPKVSKEELAEIRSSEGALQSVETKKDVKREPWYAFFKVPTFVLVTLTYFCFQYINFLILTWTPKYLQDVFHFELYSLWYLGMIPWIGACFTLPLGAKISDRILRKTGNLRLARTGIPIISLLLTTICFACIPMMNHYMPVLILMSLGNACAFMSSSLYWAIIVDTAPVQAGTYSGIMHFIANIATILAPTLTGYLVVSYGYSSMFVVASMLAMIGMSAMLFVKPGQQGRNEGLFSWKRKEGLGGSRI